ncbi:MAG: hypothetical protein ACRDUW_05725, partial [Pseudonocardiaceae bacterium]
MGSEQGVQINAGGSGGARRRGWRARVGGYAVRGVLSGAALVCAGLVVVGLGTVAAPLPDRG